MKKTRLLISILLTAVLSILGSTVAFAADSDATAHTPRAAEKLVEYLTTLSPEEIITTLQDKDYLNLLLMDYYWEPYEQNDPLTSFAKQNGLRVTLTEETPMRGQYAFRLSGITVDRLADKLTAQKAKAVDADHRHDWMYFDVTDQKGNTVLLRYCQSCEEWQAFRAEASAEKQTSSLPTSLTKSR